MADQNHSPNPEVQAPPPLTVQSIDPRAKAEKWRIATVGGAGGSRGILGGGAALLQLWNMETGYSWPYVFTYGAAGKGFDLKRFGILKWGGGASLSNPSATDFRVVPAIGPEAFDSPGSMWGIEATVLLGGSLTYGNIYKVNHDPNPLDLGGVTVGINLSIGYEVGLYTILLSQGMAPTVTGQNKAAPDPAQVLDDFNSRRLEPASQRLIR